MAVNKTHPSLNSTAQPDLWSTCPAEEIFAWQQHYLTPTNFILFVIAIVLETPMCVATTLLNVLVIVAVWRKRYLRKQKSCVLLACLAATDLLVGAVVLPLVNTGHIMRLVGAGLVCVVDKITMETLHLACGASLFHLAIISGERYVAIKHALRYETLVTTRRLTIAVAAAWVIAPVSGVLSTVILKVSGEAAPREMAMTAVATLWTSVLVFSVAYFQVAVFIESRRHRKHIRAHQVSEAAAREILKKDKAARTTAMIVGALCLCYAPAIGLAAATMTPTHSQRGTALASLHTAQLLVCCNSLINPIIYCVRTQDFKRAIGELLNLETSQVNPEFVIPENRRLQRQEGTVRPMSSRQNKLPIAQSVTRAACHSRSRSLDLSSDPTHVKTRRTNSI